jgi:hypothetical protein
VIAPLNQLYGMLPAKDFGPLALKAVRVKMVESGWCRSTINAGMSRIRRIFKHAIANELIDSAVLDRLKCVAALLAGRTEAHDNAPRSAVSPEDIETIRKSVSAIVRDLFDVQRLTGARSGDSGLLCSDSDSQLNTKRKRRAERDWASPILMMQSIAEICGLDIRSFQRSFSAGIQFVTES